MMDGEPKGDSYSGMSLSDADLARLVSGGVLDPREVLRAIEKYEAEGSLLAFLRLAWPQFEPGKLEISWHHEAIAEHLEAVSAGEIRRLLINVPPRSSKTSIVSIAWPAWIWCQSERTPLKGPQVRFMCVCYAASLSLEIATTARRLVTSDWYQGWWGDRVAPDPDEFNRARFANKAGGYRIAASIEGGTLGRGGDVKIIDDPNKVSDVESEIERMRVLRAYDEALATRVTDPRSTAEVVIMQRLHEEDLSGHILSQNIGGWDHLMIPQQYDPRRYVQTSIGWTDPRGALDEEEQAEYDGALAVNPKAPHPHDGMLMWPDRFDEEWVEREQVRMGSVAWSGQMQQIPVGRGTEIIKPEWWQFWGEDEFPEYGTCVASLDTAYSERETADYNAFTLWFAFQGVDGRPKVMLASAWRVRTNLADLARRVVRSCQGLAPLPLRVATDGEGRLVPEKVGPKAEILLIEDATRGKDLRDEIWRLLGGRRQLRVDLVRPAGDKVARLNSCVPVFEAGVVYAPERDWSDEVINEIASFPRGRHDDYCDSTSMAIRWMRENGVALRGSEHEEELRERRTYRKRQSPLYDV